jgi:hypothetical protein
MSAPSERLAVRCFVREAGYFSEAALLGLSQASNAFPGRAGSEPGTAA